MQATNPAISKKCGLTPRAGWGGGNFDELSPPDDAFSQPPPTRFTIAFRNFFQMLTFEFF